MMSLETIIKGRVSQKSYTDQKVDRELVLKLLNTAVYAPNHKMRQPWRFIIIDGKARLDMQERYTKKIKPELKEKVDITFGKILKAPLIIAFVMPTNLDYDIEFEDIQANASVIQNFLLLAEEAGLSTHWKTPGFIKTDHFKAVLDVKNNELVAGLIMVGYADEKAHDKPRYPAETITTFYK